MAGESLTKHEIKHVVRDYIVNEFLPGEDPESLTDGTLLFSDGVLNSLASLKLVSYLEERFRIKIEAHEVDVEHLDTLDSIAAMVISKSGVR
jgi:acyl carrier protein